MNDVKKRIMIGLLFVAVGLLFVSEIRVNSVEVNEDKTEVEVFISESKGIDDRDDEKESIYTPDEPKPVRVLPDTGELITSFIYILIGLSVLLFLFGILISRIMQNDEGWDY